MTEAGPLHDEAMRHAQEAHLARNSDDEEAALVCFRRAFKAERQAARAYVSGANAEPTRSVLLRSAASLAMECGEPREAERLAAEGLLGVPPVAIASELRDVLSAAYSAQDDSLVGRSAADLAATCLLHDLDNAALVVVWLGDIIDRGRAASAAPPNRPLAVDELNELRLFLDSQFATTWIDSEVSVRAFDEFRQRLRHVGPILADCIRDCERPWTTAEAREVRLSEQSSNKLAGSCDGLSRAIQEFYRQVFPDDWQPDLEPSRSRPIWPIGLPEGSRLVRLAGVVRRLPATRQLGVRAALVNTGLSAGDVHEFDTYTEIFLWQGDVDVFVPPLEQDTERRSRGLSEIEIERIVLMEMRRGYVAANHPEPDRYAATVAASWLMQTEVGDTDDPFRSAARYANVLASRLADDNLSQRIVWRICVRILAEAGVSIEPSPEKIRSLFLIARTESPREVDEWLRREQWPAGPRAISPSETAGARRKKSRRGRRKS